jgi:hypothetical protein
LAEGPVVVNPVKSSQSVRKPPSKRSLPPLGGPEIQEETESLKRQAGSGSQGVTRISDRARTKGSWMQKPHHPSPAAFAETHHLESLKDPLETQRDQRAGTDRELRLRPQWLRVDKPQSPRTPRSEGDDPPAGQGLVLDCSLARHAFAWIASPLETEAAFTHELVKPMRVRLKDLIGISAGNPVGLSRPPAVLP